MMRLIALAIAGHCLPHLLNIGQVLTQSWKSKLAPDQVWTTVGPCLDQTMVLCNLVQSQSGPGLGPVPLGTMASLCVMRHLNQQASCFWRIGGQMMAFLSPMQHHLVVHCHCLFG